MNTLLEAVRRIRMIDGHEHLIPAEERRRNDAGFFGLLHYTESDLITAGMERGSLRSNDGRSDEEKAALFLDYWKRTSNTAYARSLKTAMEDLYGMNDWTAAGVLELNERVKARSCDDGWYAHVLKERSGIDLAFTLIQTTDVDFTLFRPIMFMDFTYRPRTRGELSAVVEGADGELGTFRAYLAAVDKLLERYAKEGMVATKLGHAYWRTLECTAASRDDAERSFCKLLASTDEPMPQSEARPFQDYMIRFLVERSAAYGLPVQIHTGHHETSVSGDGNIITNSRVSDLVPLLLDFPQTQFVLLHAGLPYSQEYLSIAKNFPNVYADMTWVYIISPTQSKALLHQLIEMVPQTKVFGFGGDYNFVEGTYAHQKLARTLLAEVLAEKTAEGALTEDEAVRYAELVLRDNLIELYRLRERAPDCILPPITNEVKRT